MISPSSGDSLTDVSSYACPIGMRSWGLRPHLNTPNPHHSLVHTAWSSCLYHGIIHRRPVIHLLQPFSAHQFVTPFSAREGQGRRPLEGPQEHAVWCDLTGGGCSRYHNRELTDKNTHVFKKHTIMCSFSKMCLKNVFLVWFG